jgi:hypothetical protein
MGKRKTTHTSYGKSKRVAQSFGLEELPDCIPYDMGRGLALPQDLTDLEIRKIGAAAAGNVAGDSPFYVGDLLNWLQAHPESPISRAWVIRALRQNNRYSDRTIYNYTGCCRGWPVETRKWDVSYNHYYVMRSRWIPEHVRHDLMTRAQAENLSRNDLADALDGYRVRYKGEPGQQRGENRQMRALQAKLMWMVRTLEKAKSEPEHRSAHLQKLVCMTCDWYEAVKEAASQI